MRHFIPDSDTVSGGDSSHQSSGAVPSVMDNDPHADEEIIDQPAGEQYPKPVDESVGDGSAGPAKIAPDNLADSIAYALDGSGPGPTNDTPNVSGHKPITEGTTGASLDEEADAMRS